MIDKKKRYRVPTTVDEAAELLLSDLLIQHLQALSGMAKSEFDVLCKEVTPYLNEEFQIWQGNNALLESCYNQPGQDCQEGDDPARIILAKVMDIIKDFHGFLIIT